MITVMFNGANLETLSIKCSRGTRYMMHEAAIQTTLSFSSIKVKKNNEILTSKPSYSFYFLVTEKSAQKYALFEYKSLIIQYWIDLTEGNERI